MKKTLLLIVFASFLFASCEQMFEHAEVDMNNIFNTWNLEKIETKNSTETATGTKAGDKLVLNEDYSYVMVENGATSEGTFELEDGCPQISLMEYDEENCKYFYIEEANDSRLIYTTRQFGFRNFGKTTVYMTAAPTQTTNDNSASTP